MKEKTKDIGQIVVDICEAFAKVEEGQLSFEYSSTGYISGIRNSTGLTIPYYQKIAEEIEKNQNILFQAIAAVPSLAEYCLSNPQTTYKGVKRLLKEIVKGTIF